ETVAFEVSVGIEDGDQACSATGEVEVILHATAGSIPFDTTTLTIWDGDLVLLHEGGDSSLSYYWQPEAFFADAREVNASTGLYTSQELMVTITEPVSECSITYRKKVNVLPVEDIINIDYAFVCGEAIATLTALDIPEGAGIEW